MKIKISFTVLLLFSVVLFSGCLDAGLKKAAQREKERMGKVEASTEEKKQEEEIIAGEDKITSEEVKSEVDKLLGELENLENKEQQIEVKNEEESRSLENLEEQLPACESCEKKEDPKKVEIENTPMEEPLLNCGSINLENCTENDEQVVCAKVRAKIGEEIKEEWLDFKNACTACKINSQAVEGNTLEIIGYRMGNCQ